MAEVVPQVFALGGVLRRYDWGSTSQLQELLGDEPDGRPAAELWFGAHAGDPSPALGGTLDAVVAADPSGLLGPDTVRRFGPSLPFLLKLLAADTPLSIQVHPSAAQARAGFAREDAAGIPRDAPQRTYVDRNHKPELLCALTPFEALCGFRPPAATVQLLADVGIAELDFVADLLRGPDGLRAAFTGLLRHPDPAGLAAAVTAVARADGSLRPAWLAAQHFPGDIGVVLTLLLNHVRLEPGEAIYLGAGNVHAYLGGLGVEIMASSDNVLRCGLTSKHVDVDELLAVTDFRALDDPRWPADGDRFSVPVADFALRSVDGAAAHTVLGPAVVLAVTGTVRVGELELRPGRAAFVTARGAAQVAGSGRAYVASPG